MTDKTVVNNEDEYEEDPIYFCYSATLRIYGDFDIDTVSNAMRLKPTHSHRKGEQSSKIRNTVYDRDMWMFESPVPEDRPLDVHIQKLWELLKPHKDYLITLKNTVTLDVFCGYRSNSSTAGFEVSPASLQIFIELDLPFGVSVIIA